MRTGARVIQIYRQSTNKKRLDLICANYNCLDSIIKADIRGLIILIREDKASKRRAIKGDLGVHIQGTGGFSNPTAESVETEMMLKEAIINCDFSSGVIDGIDHEHFVIDRSKSLYLIRRDWTMFNEQLDCLEKKDREFFLLYLKKERDIYELSEEFGITYKSIQKRITRIKNQIDEGMHPLDYIN